MEAREGDELSAGRFWLPGREGEALEGGLTLSSHSPPRLELDGFLFGAPVDDTQPFVVLGELRPDATPVTLVDAYGVGWTNGTERMQASYVVLGRHVDGRQQRYTGVRVRLQHLDEWARMAVLPAPVPLPAGGRLDVEHVGDSQRSTWLRVVELPELPGREVDRRLLNPLSTLVTLAADADCMPLAVDLRVDPDDPWLSVRAPLPRPLATSPRWAASMLVPLAVLGLDGVATWLGKVESLTPVPPVVASARTGPRRSLEARVLELCTVAEGLDRRLRPGELRPEAAAIALARDEALAGLDGHAPAVVKVLADALQHVQEPSYRQRLKSLAERAAEAVPGVTGKRTAWAAAVVDSRHEFAHQSSTGFLNEGRVDRYVAVQESLRWLLTGVLLRESGLPAATLGERFQRHMPYQLFLEQAPDWLPAVYRQA